LLRRVLGIGASDPDCDDDGGGDDGWRFPLKELDFGLRMSGHPFVMYDAQGLGL